MKHKIRPHSLTAAKRPKVAGTAPHADWTGRLLLDLGGVALNNTSSETHLLNFCAEAPSALWMTKIVERSLQTTRCARALSSCLCRQDLRADMLQQVGVGGCHAIHCALHAVQPSRLKSLMSYRRVSELATKCELAHFRQYRRETFDVHTTQSGSRSPWTPSFIVRFAVELGCQSGKRRFMKHKFRGRNPLESLPMAQEQDALSFSSLQRLPQS